MVDEAHYSGSFYSTLRRDLFPIAGQLPTLVEWQITLGNCSKIIYIVTADRGHETRVLILILEPLVRVNKFTVRNSQLMGYLGGVNAVPFICLGVISAVQYSHHISVFISGNNLGSHSSII
jgi:hypothetical protein